MDITGEKILNVEMTRIIPILDLGDIDILEVDGKPFCDAQGSTASLSEARVVGKLSGLKITIKFRSKTIWYTDARIGLDFRLFPEPVNRSYENTGSWKCYGPQYHGTRRRGQSGGGEWVSTVTLGEYGYGYWCPDIYNARVEWGILYWDGAVMGGGEFIIKNILECTGSGQNW